MAVTALVSVLALIGIASWEKNRQNHQRLLSILEQRYVPMDSNFLPVLDAKPFFLGRRTVIYEGNNYTVQRIEAVTLNSWRFHLQGQQKHLSVADKGLLSTDFAGQPRSWMRYDEAVLFLQSRRDRNAKEGS